MRTLDYLLVVSIIISSIGAVLVYRMNTETNSAPTACPMDALLCTDGTTLGRSGRDCTFPTCPTTSKEESVDGTAAGSSSQIRIISPLSGTRITSPATISGEARGFWFFEGSFPILITDESNAVIGSGFATAEGAWMTESFVPFTARVEFTKIRAQTEAGVIVFKKDNPSGLPEHDARFEVPVTF